MAGAATACVPARAGTILGVTRSDANPTYRRLEQYEPLLRLAVPAILALFLLTLAASAWIQVREGRESTLARRGRGYRHHRLAVGCQAWRSSAPADRNAAAAQLDAVVRGMPAAALTAKPHPRARRRGRQRCWRSIRPPCRLPATLIDLLGEAQPLTTFADRAGVMTIKLASGVDGIATVRSLPASSGQIALVQPLPRVLSGWWSRTVGHVSLLGATIVVLLGIGIAYVMQANRARAPTRSARRSAIGSIPLSIAAAADCGTGISDAAGSIGRIPCTNFSATSVRTSSCRSARSTP